LIAKKNPDGSRYYFHSDHLGSTTILTNQSGSVVERTKYDPWGEVLDGGSKSKYLYTGQEKDQETNLHYYNARYYDPHIRRFTQPDDIIQNLYDPQYLNRYAYVRNNPLKYTDPTGHLSILDYNNALNQYYKKPSATSYNNVLNTISAIQKESTSPKASGQSSGGNNSGASRSSNSGGSNNAGSTNLNPVAAIAKNASNLSSQTLIAGINQAKGNIDNNINSVGGCFQGSAGAGAGAGGGGGASACLYITKEQGLVFTGSVGPRYVLAGAEVGAGPAISVTNARNASELSGVDIVAGGTLKTGGGVEIEHGRSIGPGSFGLWSWTVNPQAGFGGTVYGGMNVTGAIDIPGL
jgi:RHS repeat-associated protein